MYCVSVGNGIENAQNVIVRPGWSFNFDLSEIPFFESCDAHVISNARYFCKIFGTYAARKCISI